MHVYALVYVGDSFTSVRVEVTCQYCMSSSHFQIDFLTEPGARSFGWHGWTESPQEQSVSAHIAGEKKDVHNLAGT